MILMMGVARGVPLALCRLCSTLSTGGARTFMTPFTFMVIMKMRRFSFRVLIVSGHGAPLVTSFKIRGVPNPVLGYSF